MRKHRSIDREQRGRHDAPAGAEQAYILHFHVQRPGDQRLVGSDVAFAIGDFYFLGRVRAVEEGGGNQVHVDALELQVVAVASIVTEVEHRIA